MTWEFRETTGTIGSPRRSLERSRAGCSDVRENRVSEAKWLDEYAGQTADELIALQGNIGQTLIVCEETQ